MSPQQYSGPLQPPEPGEPRTDPWGWLYREGEPTEATPPRHAAPPPSGYQPSQPPAYAPQGYAPPAYVPAPPAPPPTGYEPTYEPAPEPPVEPEQRRRTGLIAALIVGALVLVVVIGLVLVNLSRSPTSSRPPATTAPPTGASTEPAISAPPSTPAPTPSGSGSPYAGAVSPITATGATAKCVAPDATDGNGDPVSYAAVRAVDGDLGTAWRCDGAATGQTLRVALPAGSTVARLGLVNGYVKTDPKTGADRYGEYRRITRVRWELSNGTSFEQTLKDENKAIQNLQIPVQSQISWVQVTILASTAPGSTQATRDAVLISEIGVSRPG